MDMGNPFWNLIQRFASVLALHRAKNVHFYNCVFVISLLYLGSSVVFPNYALVYIFHSYLTGGVFFVVVVFSLYMLLFLHSYIFTVWYLFYFPKYRFSVIYAVFTKLRVFIFPFFFLFFLQTLAVVCKANFTHCLLLNLE